MQDRIEGFVQGQSENDSRYRPEHEQHLVFGLQMGEMHRSSIVAMNTKTRPVYIIERDIRETMDKAAKAVRQGRYMDAAILAERADNLKEELSYAMELVKFDEDNRNMDKSLRSWFGKILSLSLNEADMALYHIDMFFAYMQDRGYVPVPEWERKRRELREAVIGYRNFVKHFFKDDNNLVNNEIDFMHLLDTVRDKMFTEQEKVYYDKYEIKAGEKQ